MTNYKKYAVNCDTCGREFLNSELKTVKLSCFSNAMRMCDSCLDKTAEQNFKDARDVVNEIVSISKRGESFEERIELIRRLLNE